MKMMTRRFCKKDLHSLEGFAVLCSVLKQLILFSTNARDTRRIFRNLLILITLYVVVDSFRKYDLRLIKNLTVKIAIYNGFFGGCIEQVSDVYLLLKYLLFDLYL